jgi:hypothetical protein
MASFNDPADRTLIPAAFAVAEAPSEFKTSVMIINDILVTGVPPIEFASLEMPTLLAVDVAGKSYTASRQQNQRLARGQFCFFLK